MHFVEAIELRTKTGRTINIDGEIYKVLVIPNNPNDFKAYCEAVMKVGFNNVQEGLARLISSDDDYQLRAFLWKNGILIHQEIRP